MTFQEIPTKTITLESVEEILDFLNDFDGYGLVITDEDDLRERAEEVLG